MLGYVTAVTPNHVGANPFDLLSFQRSYSFRHALIGDAAYESLLRSKRRQYHRQIAAALQESFPEIVNANPELIAVHYTDAGLVEQAVTSWQRAGAPAAARWSLDIDAMVRMTDGRADVVRGQAPAVLSGPGPVAKSLKNQIRVNAIKIN